MMNETIQLLMTENRSKVQEKQLLKICANYKKGEHIRPILSAYNIEIYPLKKVGCSVGRAYNIMNIFWLEVIPAKKLDVLRMTLNCT